MSEITPLLQQAAPPTGRAVAFSLDNTEAYEQWRQSKLADFPASLDNLLVSIEKPTALTEMEKGLIERCLSRANIAIYKCKGSAASKEDIQSLVRQLGLAHIDNNLCADEDRITSIQVNQTGRHGGYIPYSNKRLSWHTDGYYNPSTQTVRSVVLHCVRPAAHGGENMLLDPEILYIHLRDQDPRWIEALMHPDAMIIPANVEKGKEIRTETRGPVFSVDDQGYLHMRYSARTKNIEWLENEHIKQATDFITDFLASDSPYIFRCRLKENEGVISNNVLHNRTAFEDDEKHSRLLFRARFYDRVNIRN